MENRKGILNCKEKTFTFKFRNEVFTIDLKEGDLEDSWNSILLNTGEVLDFNFHWDETPYASLFGVKPDENGEMLVDMSDETPIKIKEVVGTKADYFELPFNSSLPLKFELVNNQQVIYKTKSLYKLSDERVKRNVLYNNSLIARAVDTNGATKEL